MDNHNLETKIAVINDVTGFGKCGAMVSVPVISAAGIQCCVLPTSIFSNHTAYTSYFMDDYTEHMQAYMDEWEKLGLTFDGILTGFYGSEHQIDIVTDFIKRFASKETKVIVDPIMGDNGKPYATYNEKMCRKMSELVRYAHITTPNVTEACILTGTGYKKEWTEEELYDMCMSIHKNGPEKIVITGIEAGDDIGNYIFEDGHGRLCVNKRTGRQRCGTGDIFSSIIAARAVGGCDFAASVQEAADFIGTCIKESDRIGMPVTDGVCFERFLYQLTAGEKQNGF